MGERPILFSDEMVRAILAGRKTQTRRPLKLGPDPGRARLLSFEDGIATFGDSIPDDPVPLKVRSPVGVPGDRLWVREAWELSRDARGDWLGFRAGGDSVRINRPGCPTLTFVDDGRRTWRPSIHLPRWASRLTLLNLAVRIQRVQDISEEDAIAEGVGPHPYPYCREARRHTQAFASRWDAIYSGPYSWASNPWIAAATFRRLDVSNG